MPVNDIMQRAKRELTAKELEAFRLHRAGEGYEAIADKLGISRSAARDRVRSARRTLNLPRVASAAPRSPEGDGRRLRGIPVLDGRRVRVSEPWRPSATA
jgi:DNA-binding CsgD family transcriptional regulator